VVGKALSSSPTAMVYAASPACTPGRSARRPSGARYAEADQVKLVLVDAVER
jgi:hypothetical protein